MAVFSLPPISTAFVAICKRSFTPLFDENDPLPISNLAALRDGLDALVKQDAGDKTRADELWTSAIKTLQTEEENLIGAAAQGVVQMDDDFEMAGVGGEMDGWWGYGYGPWRCP